MLNFIINILSSLAQHKVSGQIFWFCYLFCMFVISFITQKYESNIWIYFSSGFYLLVTVYLLAVIFGAKCHWVALQNARIVIICLSLTILWLMLQKMIGENESILFSQFNNSSIPRWFIADFYLSVVPEKTHWLMFSNIFVLSWFVLSLALIDSRQRLKQLLFVLLGIGTFHALIGISALYSGIYLTDIKQLDGHYDAARGWFVNRNHFASFLVLCLIGSITIFIKEIISHRDRLNTYVRGKGNLFVKLIYLAGAIVIISALLLSQSRAGFIAIFVVFILALSIFSRFTKEPSRFNNYFLVVCLLAVIGIILYFGGDLFKRLSGQALSLGERTLQWTITWEAIKTTPIFGYGGGSYATVFQFFREYSDLRQVVYNQSHNDYLQLWLEQGLIGLILWLTVIYYVLRRAILIISKSKSNYVVSVSLSALIIIIAALLQAGVDFNLQIINIRCYFFTLMSIILVLPTISHKHNN